MLAHSSWSQGRYPPRYAITSRRPSQRRSQPPPRLAESTTHRLFQSVFRLVSYPPFTRICAPIFLLLRDVLLAHSHLLTIPRGLSLSLPPLALHASCHQLNIYSSLTPLLGSVVALVLLPISATTVNVPITIYVQAHDQYGNRNFGYSGAVTLSVASGISVIGSGIVTLTSGQGSRSLTSIIAQTATAGLSDTQSTGLNVSSTQNLVFISGLLDFSCCL